eukprot:UN05294
MINDCFTRFIFLQHLINNHLINNSIRHQYINF